MALRNSGHSLPWGAAVAAVLTMLGTAVPALAVDEDEERAAAATEQKDTSPGSAVEIGGVSYRWRPYIETEGGYDSNPDNLFSEDGTSFLKLEGGLKASAETANQYYGLTLKGRFIDFMDLDEDIQHRTDFKAAVDTSFNLSETQTLRAGSYFLRDLISLARADIYHSYLDYALRTQDYRLRFEVKSHIEHNFDDEEQGDLSFDDFSVSRAKAFDFARTDGQMSLLTFTRFWLQPFVIYNLANSDYYNQVSGVSIDRNADEQYGIAGARLQFDKTFRIDVGYRINDRDFDDQTFREFTTDYIDVNVFWQPVDTVRITAIVERFFDEASTSFGLADDVKSHGVTLEWQFSPKWRLAGTTYYDIEDSIGEDILYKKLTSTLSITYDANDNLEVFLSTLGKWVEEEDSGDTYDRYKAGLGARLKF